MFYGIDNIDVLQKAASYVDRILRGAKPADLPVQAPTKYETAVNLTAAKAIGLTIPPTLCGRRSCEHRVAECDNSSWTRLFEQVQVLVG